MNARQKAKYYKRKYEQIENQSMESLVKEVRRHDVDTLELNRLYSDREIEDDFIQSTVKRDLALEIAKQMDRYVEYRTNYLPEIQKYRLIARVRIVRCI